MMKLTRTPAACRALVIDDDRDLCSLVGECLEQTGMHVTRASSVETGIRAFDDDTNLIVLDLRISGDDGVQLLRQLASRSHHCAVILMTGLDQRTSEAVSELAVALGFDVVGRLSKPFRLDELMALTRDLRRRDAARSTPRAKAQLVEMVDRATVSEAFESCRFVPYFQPQIDLRSGSITGVEALVRMRHATRGVLPPSCFLETVEGCGGMERLTRTVLQRSLIVLRSLERRAGIVADLSINVAPCCLSDLRFPDQVAAYVAESGIDPARVSLEITEGGLLRDLDRTLDVLTRLRIKGLRLSVDDYGTGYAMMQQLRHIPATELKIDRSFVSRLPDSANDRVMVRKTTEMAHDMGMRVVAEGVETQAQLDFLRDIGCDLAQGYLFSPPLPEAELAEWLTNRAAA